MLDEALFLLEMFEVGWSRLVLARPPPSRLGGVLLRGGVGCLWRSSGDLPRSLLRPFPLRFFPPFFPPLELSGCRGGVELRVVEVALLAGAEPLVAAVEGRGFGLLNATTLTGFVVRFSPATGQLSKCLEGVETVRKSSATCSRSSNHLHISS